MFLLSDHPFISQKLCIPRIQVWTYQVRGSLLFFFSSFLSYCKLELARFSSDKSCMTRSPHRYPPDNLQTTSRHPRHTECTNQPSRQFPDTHSTAFLLIPLETTIIYLEVVGGWLAGWSFGNHTTSWFHLTSWNFPDSQLGWEFKMKSECGKKVKAEKVISNNKVILFYGENAINESMLHCC